jgi:hypothetical protein
MQQTRDQPESPPGEDAEHVAEHADLHVALQNAPNLDRIAPLIQEALRLQAEMDAMKRELAVLQRQHEQDRVRNAALEDEVASLRQEKQDYFRPFSVALVEPLRTLAPAQDFIRCVIGWNTTLELHPGTVFSQVIPVTCRDHWELVGEYQYLGRPDIAQYIGLDCYTDLEGRPENQICPQHVNVVAGTDAVLAAPCDVDDTVLSITGAENWRLETWGRHNAIINSVAFGPNRLPNFTVSPRIKNLNQMGGVPRVELQSGLRQAWPAGTPVRMHRTGAVFVYGHTSPVPSEWTEIKITDQRTQLRPEPRSVKIVVIASPFVAGHEGEPPVDRSRCLLRVRNLRWRILP